MSLRRSILVAAVVLIAVACIKKAKSHRESEWHGLTESEARSKLDDKLPSRVPDDKRSAISDKVIAKMRDRGVIDEDRDVADEPSETAETVDLREGAGEMAEPAEN
ncbi:MAG: hypothetical protein OES13_03870 [Acidimicrobiia bacterium]|nr:hypothetical protein [Acidimicrobiia bacterium]